jgi:hypothetical protein
MAYAILDGALLIVIIILFLAAVVCNSAILFCKRRDVSLFDIYWPLPVKHGFLRFLKKPDVYFRKKYVQYVLVNEYAIAVSIPLVFC